MSEILTKLRPDRDLQCYFQRPSAVAALSAASATGFTVSGSWRQQFDWAVVEWNRDNVFEHPQLRNLPDGDLSGIVLHYREERVNCIAADSTLYPTVDWPSLRIWADPGTGEQVYKVPLLAHATPAAGTLRQASATFTLSGSASQGNLVELAWEGEHYYYAMESGDSLEDAAVKLASDIAAISTTVSAAAQGTSVVLTVKDTCAAYSGANGNRLGAYALSSGLGATAYWSPEAQQFSGGESPSAWAIALDFAQLKESGIPTDRVRKMRWTYAADLQPAAFNRTEFSVTISDWLVTGTGLTYSVAGPGSRRIEDTSSALTYAGEWTTSEGNFSNGSIHVTNHAQATCRCVFVAERSFDVYVGTRRASNCAVVTICLDGMPIQTIDLALPLEDMLVRLPVGSIEPGQHTLLIQHTGTDGTYLYIDFIDLVVATTDLPSFPRSPKTTLATDWDTDHSIALAPERTAWLINKLGFAGRANHYAGALWFYELIRSGHRYASATISFGGRADANRITTLSLGVAGSPYPPDLIKHLHLSGDTTETIAKAFELRINSGYTAVWARATSSTLWIQSRSMGSEGNNITLSIATNSPSMLVAASSDCLAGGLDGDAGGVSDFAASGVSPAYAHDNRGWRTDLEAIPRINRAARDWSRSFCAAMNAANVEVTTAFSTELQHGDPSVEAGIAQRYPSGAPVILTTPALQTNFSPESLSFWRQVYADMAQVMVEAGQTPSLQFGEVQWWYFAYDPSGMPFYDSYTKDQFADRYKRPIETILSNDTNPADHPEEAEFLPTLIGAFTTSIQEFVRQSQPGTRFEVLYPCDTNDYAFTRIVNLPRAAWTSSTIDCLKTENFTYTGDFNLKLATEAVNFPLQLGFPAHQASHLIGISGPSTPWRKEADSATAAGLESIVLFALDQYCLIGYQAQSPSPGARSFMIP